MILYKFISGEDSHRMFMYKNTIKVKRKHTTKMVEPVQVLTSHLIRLGDAY